MSDKPKTLFGYPVINSGEGGSMIPETAFVDVAREGKMPDFIRWLGNKIIFLGARIYKLGFKQKKIYPRRELWAYIKDDKT